MSFIPLGAPDGSRFCQVTWDDVLRLGREQWGGARADAGRIFEALTQVLEEGDGPWDEWRHTRTEDAVASGVRLAGRTHADGRQRALDHPSGSIEELESVRVELRDALAADDSSVRPWVWLADRSGGEPMTATGAESGYEPRLSRYGSA